MARGDQIITALQVGKSVVDFGRDVLGNRHRRRIEAPSPPDFSQGYQELQHLAAASAPREESPPRADRPSGGGPGWPSPAGTAGQVDYCAPCGPEKHLPVARKLLQEARERFDENGKLTPDGTVRVRDAIMELRTYTDTDLRVIPVEGAEKEYWEDIREITTDMAHFLGTGGKRLNLGEGGAEDLDRAIADLGRIEGMAYEGLIRFGVRKGINLEKVAGRVESGETTLTRAVAEANLLPGG